MRTIDDIYKNIGQEIIANISSTSWDSAWINVKVLDSAAGVDGEYFDTSSNAVGYFEVNDTAFDDFEELCEIMSENNKWNRAKFTLFPTGKFNIDFEWDQSLADEIENLS